MTLEKLYSILKATGYPVAFKIEYNFSNVIF